MRSRAVPASFLPLIGGRGATYAVSASTPQLSIWCWRATGRDNRTTAWSVHAIETRGLLSRGRAVMAINTLKSSGAIDQTGQGGRATRYTLRAAADIPALKLRRGELTDWEAEAVENVRNGRKPDSFANGAAEKGWLVRSGKNYVLADEPNLEPDLIWLPNSLVDGAGGEPVSPLKLASQPQDPLLLRLLVDLYHSQDLAEHGGIHWRTIRYKYERHRLCQVGPFVIWEFSVGGDTCWPDQAIFPPHFSGQRDTAEWEKSASRFWARWGS